ncbi:SMI1/KNR4 family protein [Priestia aryabhattai]|uniref:SMI1/KNR4 family protein n=1 Tax=Priestia TaxID=2800373 RepID=UPI003983A3A3
MITWETDEKEVSLETILDVEKAWDVLFPIDFIECVTKYHGGEPSADGFNVGKRECSFYQLLSFNQKKKDYILNVYHDLKYQLVDGIYPFGDDIADNHVCFDYRSNSQRPLIVFIDHELAYENPENGIFFVAHSFEEFINGLYEEE